MAAVQDAALKKVMSFNSTAIFTTKVCKLKRTVYRVLACQMHLYMDIWIAVLQSTPTPLQLKIEESGQADRLLQQKDQPLHHLQIQQKLAVIMILSALKD